MQPRQTCASRLALRLELSLAMSDLRAFQSPLTDGHVRLFIAHIALFLASSTHPSATNKRRGFKCGRSKHAHHGFALRLRPCMSRTDDLARLFYCTFCIILCLILPTQKKRQGFMPWRVAPQVRLELTTLRLTAEYSAIENHYAVPCVAPVFYHEPSDAVNDACGVARKVMHAAVQRAVVAPSPVCLRGRRGRNRRRCSPAFAWPGRAPADLGETPIHGGPGQRCAGWGNLPPKCASPQRPYGSFYRKGRGSASFVKLYSLPLKPFPRDRLCILALFRQKRQILSARAHMIVKRLACVSFRICTLVGIILFQWPVKTENFPVFLFVKTHFQQFVKRHAHLQGGQTGQRRTPQ